MAQAPAGVMHIAGRYAVIIPAGAVAQAPAKGGGWRRVFGAARIESTAVKAHPNLDFRWDRKPPHPGWGLLFRKEAKARAVLGLAEPVHPLPHLPRQSRLFGRRFCLHPSCGGRGTRGMLEPGSGPAHARNGVAPRGALMRSGQMQRLEGMRLALRASRRTRMAGVVGW